MDPPGLSNAVDALLAKGILRTLRPSVLVYANLFAGHAEGAAPEVRGRWIAEFHWDRGELLDPLQYGRSRMARRGPTDRVSDVSFPVLRIY